MSDTLLEKVQNGDPIQVWELCQYWDSYVGEVEANLGHEPTRGNLADVLSDFGVFPHMNYDQIQKAINIALDVYFGHYKKGSN